MSAQMLDSFVRNNIKYIFISATDVYDLFDLEKFELNAEAPHSAW